MSKYILLYFIYWYDYRGNLISDYYLGPYKNMAGAINGINKSNFDVGRYVIRTEAILKEVIKNCRWKIKG